jgi:hypothetical protein
LKNNSTGGIMAFADPQSVTIGTTPGAVSLPRVNGVGELGKFSNYDAKTVLTVGSTYGKRNRHSARLTYSKVVTDPLIATTNVLVLGGVTVTIDVPPSGFSATEQKELATALLTFLTASSNAALIKLIAGEN